MQNRKSQLFKCVNYMPQNCIIAKAKPIMPIQDILFRNFNCKVHAARVANTLLFISIHSYVIKNLDIRIKTHGSES